MTNKLDEIVDQEHLRTIDVFGVKREPILSYIKRDNVDGEFYEALETDKHIIIYGASKQGKSALIREHLNHKSYIQVGCEPVTQLRDIYSSILRQLKITYKSSEERKKSTEIGAELKAKFVAMIPVISKTEVEGTTNLKGAKETTIQYHSIEFNFELAQDICELLKLVNFNGLIVLENFHYLDEEVQRAFAFALRTFHDLGIRFVIIGIWKEKNHLRRYNRDLIDRTYEIAVEPWTKPEFLKIAEKGSEMLKIHIEDEIIDQMIEVSFNNVGIFQELCKELCLHSGIAETQLVKKRIYDIEDLENAIQKKVKEYGDSHTSSLDSIAVSGAYENGLFLPYYLVCVILEADIGDLNEGISKKDLLERIQRIHHKKDNVRNSDISHLLKGLVKTQSKHRISPPLFDYDTTTKKLRVIDTTLMFYLNFADTTELIEELDVPMGLN